MYPADTLPYGVMFHHFHNAQHYQGQGSISADQLAALLEFLGPARILTPQEWVERATHDALQPSDICLTFDDNLRCQYDVAKPVLDTYGLKAFWMVYSEPLQGRVAWLEVYRYFRHVYFAQMADFYAAFVDELQHTPYAERVAAARPIFEASDYLKAFTFYTDLDRWFRYLRDEVLSVAEYDATMRGMLTAYDLDPLALTATLCMDDACLRTLHAEGHMIGLHGHTHHNSMGKLSYAEQLAEYGACSRHLHELLGERPVSMSYPCGSYNDQTSTVLSSLGVQVGFDGRMDGPADSPLLCRREEHVYLIQAMQAAEAR